MQRLQVFSVGVLTLSLLSGCGAENKPAEAKIEPNTTVTMAVSGKVINTYDVPDTKFTMRVEEKEENKRPKYNLVPETYSEALDKIYELAEANNISYTLIMAISKVESDFNAKAVSSTNDFGITQTNKRNIKWLAEQEGIENVDPLKPEHSFRLCLGYLKYLRDYFDKFNMPEEQKFYYIVGAYNLGENGVQRYAKIRNIRNQTYVKAVLEAKNEIEQSEVTK